MSSIHIDTPNVSKKQEIALFWRGVFIWVLATLFYFFDNLLNAAPGGMIPQLSAVFNLSYAELGVLASCYLWSYGIMQIPAGLLMDSIGPRRSLTFAGIACIFGTILFGMAHSIGVACAGRVLIGFGSSFAVVGCTKIAANWFPPRRFALFMGLMVAVGMLGGAFGVAAMSPMIDTYGWQQTSIAFAVFALAITVLLWTFVRDRPPIHIAAIPETQNSVSVPVLVGLKEVIMCGQDWLAAIYAALMFVPTIAFGALWGTPYLVEAHGFDQSSAGLLSSLVFVGWVFGGPMYGWISDHFGRRNLPMYFANISTLLVSLWIIYGDGHTFASLTVFMFLLGFFSSGFVIAFVVTREKNRPEIAGTAIGFMNMINTFGGAFLQLLIGWILDKIASDVILTEGGQALFTRADYQMALISIPICLVIAFIALLGVKETYGVVHHEE